jgi:fumarate reductase subunit C
VKTRGETLLWVAQRASAALLAVCVAVHVVTIVWAVRGGLTAAEILSRTRGSAAWFAFYCVFVVAASVHAPIGLRAVAIDWLRWRGTARDALLFAAGGLLAVFGLRAAWAVFA